VKTFFALFLGASFTATPAFAATGTMNIGIQTGVSLTANASGPGWTWTALTETLALTGTTYIGGAIAVNCATTDNINLEYTGNVNITSAATDAVYCNGNLTITGSGGTITTATTAANAYGIQSANGNISINGSASVTAFGTVSGGRGIQAGSGAVSISTTGNVTAAVALIAALSSSTPPNIPVTNDITLPAWVNMGVSHTLNITAGKTLTISCEVFTVGYSH
jgi:hypothetical protein